MPTTCALSFHSNCDHARLGPWEFEPSDHQGISGFIRARGSVLAQVKQDRGTQFDGSRRVPERDRANGLLLAAAPELLDACEAADAQIVECIQSDNPQHWYENAIATLAALRAAIAKAKGEAPNA
jgi:hypothetical protein